MIKPTIGRKLWYWDSAEKFNAAQALGLEHSEVAMDVQPEDATIVGVWSPSLVNLYVINHGGTPRAETSVQLIQEGDHIPTGRFCTWMPFQVGQAKVQAAKDDLRREQSTHFPS